MTQIERDIKLLREKYGDMRSIKTAEAILRLVAFAERHKDCDASKLKIHPEKTQV